MGALGASGANSNDEGNGSLRKGNPHVVGNAVGGSAAFVGREDILRAVVRALGQPLNQGIVLFGQRRIGKTSILQHLAVTLPNRTGHRPVWFDLQARAAASLGDVLTDLASDIARELRLPEPKPEDSVEDWFGGTWLPAALAALPDGISLVLLFDEFDVLADVNARQAASALFPYLQRLLDKNAPRLRAVFVIGRNIDDIENVAHALFKGLPSYQVTLLERRDAEALIRLGEANGTIRWENDAVNAAWELTHGHPLWLQALCSQVWDSVHQDRPATRRDVDEAVEPTLGATRAAFEWLWKGLTPGKRIVAAALAQAGAAAISEEDLNRILGENGVRVFFRDLRDAPRMLIEWDLLEAPVRGQYQFRVELLRQWIERFKPIDRVREELDKIEPAADALYKAAEALHTAGEMGQAVARLHEVLGHNPYHSRASELLAEIAISKKDWKEARSVLERLYENHPSMASTRLADVLLVLEAETQNENDRLGLLHKVLEVDSKNKTADARLKQITKERGDRARAEGDLTTARALYQEACRADLVAQVNDEFIRESVRRALLQVEILESQEDYGLALDQIRELTERYPNARDWALYRARIESAAQMAQTYRLGVQAFKSRDVNEAKKLLASVVGHNPDYKEAVTLLNMLVNGTRPWSRDVIATAIGAVGMGCILLVWGASARPNLPPHLNVGGMDNRTNRAATTAPSMSAPPPPASSAGPESAPSMSAPPPPASSAGPEPLLTCPEGMAVIGEGTMEMGSTNGYENERPVHRLRVDAFCLDLTEVTADAYAECVDSDICTATGLSGPNSTYKVRNKGDYPINYVDWNQASAYCKWRQKRLPSEQEWEWGARGPDTRTYPWGNDEPKRQLCWKTTGPCSTGRHPEGRNSVAIEDLAGNVWEWTDSHFCNYPKHACTTRNERVIRGGSWEDDKATAVRASYRGYVLPNQRQPSIGFRCATNARRGHP